jgi:hypothetical protein
MDPDLMQTLYPHAAAAREIVDTTTRDLIQIENKIMEFTAETPRTEKSRLIGEFLRLHREMIKSEEFWHKTLIEEMEAVAEANRAKSRRRFRFRFWK